MVNKNINLRAILIKIQRSSNKNKGKVKIQIKHGFLLVREHIDQTLKKNQVYQKYLKMFCKSYLNILKIATRYKPVN